MIQIANLQLSSPLFLAPLAGFTDLPFRTIARSHGAGLVYTELISAEGIVRNNKKTKELMHISNDEQPVAMQIFGKDAHVMAEAARIVETLHPAIIDINMGCCAAKVCSGHSGAALLKDIPRLYKIAHEVVQAVAIPVSAKIRIGWDSRSKNYREVVTALQDAGISFIAVHGRTKTQQYSGEADWEIITTIADYASVPIIGNGDIDTYQQAMKKLKASGCQAVMIGRAAIGNPWIFSGKEPALEEIITQMIAHLDAMLAYYGPYGIILIRKHLIKYIHGFRNAAHIRGQLVRATSREEIIHILDSLYNQAIP